MVEIQLLSAHNFSAASLDAYVRHQDVKRVYRRVNGAYTLVDCPYTEDWDLKKKRAVAENLMDDSFITHLALDGGTVVGFIGLKKALVDGLMILDLMQVSEACRGQGIGRKLFEAGKEEARKAGAKGLYISACSSEETIAFYSAMGATLTPTPIPEIAEDEPYDLQMVCPVI